MPAPLTILNRRHWLAASCLPPLAWAAPSPEIAVGQSLRPARLKGLNGPDRALEAFRGKPLIINVWASWCGPCRQEMASLERLAWRDERGRFKVIGLSTDDYIDKAQAFLRSSHATIDHFIDQALEMEQMLGASRLPLTVLVDARGVVLRKVVGAREWDAPDTLQLIASTLGWRKF